MNIPIPTPNPFAPDCKVPCPTVTTLPDGTEEAEYCPDCINYMDQMVNERNAARIAEQGEGEGS